MSARAQYCIRHETRYLYGADVVHSHHLLHLVPRPAPYQQCLEHTLQISPAPTYRRDEIDAFGNPVTRAELQSRHRELTVTTAMQVEVHPRPAVQPDESHPWERVAGSLAYHGHWPARANLDICRFRHESPYVRVKRAFTDFGAECFAPGRPVLSCAGDLMRTLHRELRYAPGETTVATPLMEVLEKRHGVCQDFAHLMIACLRSRGLAARYVSGYIRVRPAPPPSATAADRTATTPAMTGVEAPYGPGPDPGAAADHPLDVADAALVGGGASHAWVAVYSPPFGWIELDPTNNTWVGVEHVAVAWGRDFGDVSPLRGIILGGGSHQLSVNVTVEPVGALD
ncbi:MAG TPA: transglutaminase family protein [Steroidobacteraceae bacterium]|nr:transglutaminase family protein [Steroidobacteraceae bacterium]